VTKLRAWYAKSRWALWLMLSACLALVLYALRVITGDKRKSATDDFLPVPKLLQDKLNAAEEDSLRARVEATTQATGKKEALEDIAKIKDGVERRKRLAEMLTKL
jgi:hypothetical protein